MYQTLRFHVGDRISTKYALAQLPAGSCGTVQSVFLTVNDAYDVLFESKQTLRIVFQSDLTLLSTVQQRVAI